jgi:uncharacterized cupin superfamily protein
MKDCRQRIRHLHPRQSSSRLPWVSGAISRYDTPCCAIIRFDSPLAPEIGEPAADRLIAGKPQTRVTNYFVDPTQQFFAGRWSATRGKWRIRYTESELCVMTAGQVVIESDSGERQSFATGDAFVVPAGFSGTWEVLEDCCKIYAICEPRS